MNFLNILWGLRILRAIDQETKSPVDETGKAKELPDGGYFVKCCICKKWPTYSVDKRGWALCEQQCCFDEYYQKGPRDEQQIHGNDTKTGCGIYLSAPDESNSSER